MDGSTLIAALRAGHPVIGTLVVSPSPHWPAAVATLGLDFVFIDTEHIALSRAELAWMCRTYGAMGMAPIVRIPSPDPYQATMALDGGARGVIVPYVEQADDVRRLVGAVKLRPLKGRDLQDALFAGAALPDDLRAYLDAANAGNVLIANVESRPALDALDDILAVEGLDAVLVGPHDLSCSLGVPEAYDNPSFLAAVDDVIARARQRSKGVGVHAFDPATMTDLELAWIRRGANLIVHGADLTSFVAAMRARLALIRDAAGLPAPQTDPGTTLATEQ